MNRSFGAAVVAFGLVMSSVAGPVDDSSAIGPVAPERTFIGTLEQVATFAQSTGWHLVRASATSECDVSAVARRAQRLQNQRVRATGHFEQRRYPQGSVRVFVITNLERA